ncbi:MAG: sulfite exporter TauE/SafE family protein [Proteobacteria bacterium]|nr:sulfite exporter TauE/SafE family protein [Pseudomonadota bacterium]
MTPIEIAILTTTAFCTSALTSVVGAGGGTVLFAIMLQVMSPAAAIPIHGAVHLTSTGLRCWLLWPHLAWPLILRFSILLPVGAAIGLLLFQGLSKEVVQIMIGCFVLISLATRQLKSLQNKDLPLWAFVPIGFIAGILNIIVGAIAPILGVLVIRKDLTKENVVGTLGFFGFLGNLVKVVGFTLIGFSFQEYGITILCMMSAAMIGTRVGRALLSALDERLFMLALRIVLAALALKLIAYDGLAHLWT